MYETRQNKEKISRRIDFAGGRTRQRVKNTSQICNMNNSTIQRVGGNTIGYNGDNTNIKNLIDDARLINKIDKRSCTEANLQVLTSINENKKYNEGRKKQEKTNQVKKTYATYLMTINLDKNFIRKVYNEMQTSEQAVKYLENKEKNGEDFSRYYSESLEKNKKDFRDFKKFEEVSDDQIDTQIVEGNKSFNVKNEVSYINKKNNEKNSVLTYSKAGKEIGSENNEYIKDDFGNFIRRYAYMEKNIYQLINFAEQGVISGQTQDIKRAAGMEIPDIDPLNYENEYFNEEEKYIVEKLPQQGNEDLKKKIAIAYLHQWKGSGLRQRGVSLTATAKDNAVFGNAGESFRSDDGAKFKIDLAIVKAYNPNNILLSHYHFSSPTRKDIITSIYGDGKTRTYKYDNSVIKNRELYLQYLPEEAVVGIDVHGDNKYYQSMEDFRQSNLYKDFIRYKNEALNGKDYSGRPDEKSFKKGYEYGELLKRSQDDARKDAKKLFIKNKNELIDYVFHETKLRHENSAYWVGYTEELKSILNMLKSILNIK